MLVGIDTDNFPTLVQHAQAQKQWWNQLIHTTGGVLFPQKCCCMVYTWTPDKFSILCPNPPPLAAATIAVEPQPHSPSIPVLAHTKGTCYLGLYHNQLGTSKPMEVTSGKKQFYIQQLSREPTWCTTKLMFSTIHASSLPSPTLYGNFSLFIDSRSNSLPLDLQYFQQNWIPLQPS